MRILYFPPTGEIDLSADRGELLNLATLVATGSGTMTSDAASADVRGQIALTLLHVRADNQAVSITVDIDDRSLTITGNADSRLGIANQGDCWSATTGFDLSCTCP